MKKIKHYYFAFSILLLATSCVNVPKKNANVEANDILTDTISLLKKHQSFAHDSTIILFGDTIDIRYPEIPIKGQILILPGWDYSRKKCCNESPFCTKALQKGYVLVLPEMGKSLYASAVFLETRKEWKGFPQVKWITDTLIPYLQQQAGLFKQGQANYVFGISTGARGVALIVENTYELFRAGAALSGDYDQRQMPKDNLMKSFYGNYSDYKARWEGVDNPLMNASKVLVPLYLGHGLNDKVVPIEQTRLFYTELKRINANLPHTLSLVEKQGHDYNYWDSETDSVLKFFELSINLK